jgi:predicted MFS family arabinose efflux permease
MGILPAGSTVIKEEMGLQNSKFGLLGSMVYLGQTFGCLIAPVVFEYVSAKPILAGCLSLNILSLITFTYSRNYIILNICRFATGLFQIAICIFFPVWADVFGSSTQSSKWLGYILIAQPCGVVIGYAMCAIMLSNLGWQYTFYV